MSSKLTLAAAAIFTAALFGMNAKSATAQSFGGFFNVNTRGVSISLGTACSCDSVYTWRNDRRRVWCAETYRSEFVPAAYRTDYDCHGNGFQVLVRAGYNRRVCVPGHWDYVDNRVRVRRAGRFCGVHDRGHRGVLSIFGNGHRNRNHNRGHKNYGGYKGHRGNRVHNNRNNNRNNNRSVVANRGNNGNRGNRGNSSTSNRNNNRTVANRGGNGNRGSRSNNRRGNRR